MVLTLISSVSTFALILFTNFSIWSILDTDFFILFMSSIIWVAHWGGAVSEATPALETGKDGLKAGRDCITCPKGICGKFMLILVKSVLTYG